MPPAGERGYPDLHDHLATLERKGLLRTIDAPVNKDTELHPLVRWQFRGGIPENDRKAFLFTNVTDGRGRHYHLPVVVGALAANARIYAAGMGVPVDEIGDRWVRALAGPIAPQRVEWGICQEVVSTGDALVGEGNGLDGLPVPVSSPGLDAAPYITAAGCVTADPDTGVQNMGTYRAALKAPDRLGLKMFVNLGQGGYAHWRKYRAAGKPMPCAIVLGCPPALAYCGPQRVPAGVDEMAVAGAIVDAPLNVVSGVTVDLQVPAEAEIVIEGLIDTEFLEPEGPFGESHGHVNLEEYNLIVHVSAITRRGDAILPSIISQVTPSESSVIKRVAYEPMFLGHLRDHLGVRGVTGVAMHEPLTNLRRVLVVRVARETPPTEIWRALYGAASFQAPCGKYVIAVNEDIDPDNADAVFWAMAYRASPQNDVEILRHRDRGHGPRNDRGDEEDASLLIDATLKGDMPPVSLPAREYMENARELWRRLDLPPLKPEPPWHGYSLGQWSDHWEGMARRAAEGGYLDNGRLSAQGIRNDVAPNSPVPDRTAEKG